MTGEVGDIDHVREAAERLAYLGEFREKLPCAGTTNPAVTAEMISQIIRLLDNIRPVAEHALTATSAELRAGRVRPRATLDELAARRAPSETAGQLEAAATAVRRMIADRVLPALRDAEEQMHRLGRTAQLELVDLPGDGPTLADNVVLVHHRMGVHGPGRYHVRIFRAAGHNPVVVVGDMADNRSIAVVNCCERLLPDIAARLLDDIPGDAADWVLLDAIERHATAGPRGNDDEMASLIQHRTYRDGWTPATGGFISPAEQDELAGGTVRRWHAYDYTSANVLADGARQLVIEREQRPVTRLRNGGGFGQRIRQAVDAFWQEPEGTAGWVEEDRRRRSISDGDFTGAVLLLDGLIAALDARRPQHRIATTLDELRRLRDRLLAGGDVSPDARLYAEHEWENELRFLFSVGVDPRFAERG